MKDLWKTLRLGVYVFSLPLIATAAASGHQWFVATSPITKAAQEVAVVTDADAATDDIAAEDAYQYYVAKLDDNGRVIGRVTVRDIISQADMPAASQRVYIHQDGELVAQSTTDKTGQFGVEGLQPGAYSMTVSGDQAFSTFGIQVAKADAGEAQALDISAISPRVQRLTEEMNLYKASQQDKPTAEGVEKISQYRKSANPSTRRVRITDGVIAGRLFALESADSEELGKTSVTIVKQDGSVLKSLETDEAGNFQVDDMEPGIYGILANGAKGIAVMRFEAVIDDDIVGAYTSMFVGAMAVAQDLELPLSETTVSGTQDAYTQDGGVDAGAGVVDTAPIVSDGGVVGGCADGAVSGGACCGGGGGGGGFAGRGGALLGAAALGIGIAALATDSGTDTGGGGPVSPADTD